MFVVELALVFVVELALVFEFEFELVFVFGLGSVVKSHGKCVL